VKVNASGVESRRPEKSLPPPPPQPGSAAAKLAKDSAQSSRLARIKSLKLFVIPVGTPSIILAWGQQGIQGEDSGRSHDGKADSLRYYTAFDPPDQEPQDG
jgi:hypothetical protein